MCCILWWWGGEKSWKPPQGKATLVFLPAYGLYWHWKVRQGWACVSAMIYQKACNEITAMIVCCNVLCKPWKFLDVVNWEPKIQSAGALLKNTSYPPHFIFVPVVYILPMEFLDQWLTLFLIGLRSILWAKEFDIQPFFNFALFLSIERAWREVNGIQYLNLTAWVAWYARKRGSLS